MKNYLLIIIIILLLTHCRKEKACTEEFRMIQIAVKNSDNTQAQLNAYYVVKTSTNDTVLTHINSPYNDQFSEGITIFTDNEMNLTNKNGIGFKFTAYQDSIQVVDENYFIRHDDCHIELISGKVIVQL